jgi:hypothetical protein
MDYEFDDCYDEIEDIDVDIVDYKVLKDIQQNKQKIKKQNKNKKITKQIINKVNIENKE